MRVAHVGGGALFLIKFLVGGGLRLVDTGGGEVVGEAGITLRGRRVYVGCLFSNRDPFPSFTPREALLLPDSLFPQPCASRVGWGENLFCSNLPNFSPEILKRFMQAFLVYRCRNLRGHRVVG